MRIKSPENVRREIRLALNNQALALATKILEKALAGDSTAMLAASALLVEVNKISASCAGHNLLSIDPQIDTNPFKNN